MIYQVFDNYDLIAVFVGPDGLNLKLIWSQYLSDTSRRHSWTGFKKYLKDVYGVESTKITKFDINISEYEYY